MKTKVQIAISQPRELEFRADSDLSKMVGLRVLGTGPPHLRRKKTWRIEIAPGQLLVAQSPHLSILVQNGWLKDFRLEVHIHSS